MTVKLKTNADTNMYKAITASLNANFTEFSKISKQKFIPLDREQKNIAFDKLGMLANLTDMLCYTEINYCFPDKFLKEIVSHFKSTVKDIVEITNEPLKVEDMQYSISGILSFHNQSIKLNPTLNSNAKSIYLETKKIYNTYVLNGRQNSFNDNFSAITPRKINFKQWIKTEAKPDLIFSSDISNEKFITEIYTNNKDYISIEANDKGITLLLKNMEDKSKDIKKIISFQDLRKMIEEEAVEAVVEAPITLPIKEAKPNHPTPPDTAKSAPTSPSVVVDEQPEVIDDEQTNQPEDEPMKEAADVKTMTTEEKEKICDKETLKAIVDNLKEKDCM